MYEHYRAVADAVDIPQIVYNVPSRTGRNIAVETAVRLAEHENIRGYKAASGDLNRVSEVVERTRDQDFAVLSGDDGLTLPTLSVGGHGAISVVANIEPERTCAMVGAALEEDYAFARAIHHELGALTRQLFVETNPIPVKAAMDIRGYAPGRLRSPLTELSAAHREELAERLAELDGEPAASETPEPEVSN
jgi:4-hydroxy-tetrahydrodipicolinate synthase